MSYTIPESGIKLTLLLDHKLDEALLVVAFCDHIDQDVILLEHTVDLVVLIFNDSALSVPSDALIDVFFLTDVLSVCISECCPQIVKHW